MSCIGRCKNHSDKWVYNAFYAGTGYTVFLSWLTLPQFCKILCKDAEIGKDTSEPWPDMLWLPRTMVSTEQGSGTGHCDMSCPIPPCRKSTFLTFSRLDTSTVLKPLSAMCICLSEPQHVQSTPVEKAFRICFLKWLLLNSSSARQLSWSIEQPPGIIHQTGNDGGQKQMTPCLRSCNYLPCPSSLLCVSKLRVSDKATTSHFSKFAYCFHLNMKLILFMAAIKHHKRQMHDSRDFAVAKCAMEQVEWDSFQGNKKTTDPIQVWSCREVGIHHRRWRQWKFPKWGSQVQHWLVVVEQAL